VSTVGDAGKVPPQVGEPLIADDELAQDEQRPAVAQHVEGAGDRAVLLVVADGCGHASTSDRDGVQPVQRGRRCRPGGTGRRARQVGSAGALHG
jgi:hypothetical protein